MDENNFDGGGWTVVGKKPHGKKINQHLIILVQVHIVVQISMEIIKIGQQQQLDVKILNQELQQHHIELMKIRLQMMKIIV